MVEQPAERDISVATPPAVVARSPAVIVAHTTSLSTRPLNKQRTSFTSRSAPAYRDIGGLIIRRPDASWTCGAT